VLDKEEEEEEEELPFDKDFIFSLLLCSGVCKILMGVEKSLFAFGGDPALILVVVVVVVVVVVFGIKEKACKAIRG
jgi:hypothetical protein